MGSSAVPGSHGFGDQSSQHTADAAWWLHDPDAGAASPPCLSARPCACGSPTRSPRPHMSHRLTPDRPVPQGPWGRACQGCTLVVLLRTLADGSAKCAVYPHGLESQLPHTPHPGASGGRPALARPGGAWELR